MGAQCKLPNAPKNPLEELGPSMIWEDDDGLKYTQGNCICDFEAADVIADFVVEALSMLDKIICAAMLSAFDIVLEAGIAAIPVGGQVAGMARLAVQGAKIFAENGLEAASFFGDWVGPTCGVPDWHFDTVALFGGLTSAGDQYGESQGCFRKKKNKCKRSDSDPEPAKTKTKTKDADPTSTQETTKPSSESTSVQTSTSSQGSEDDTTCEVELDKRAAKKNIVPGKIGDTISRTECPRGKGKDNTVHITTTTGTIGFYKTLIGKECDAKKYPQACYHYW